MSDLELKAEAENKVLRKENTELKKELRDAYRLIVSRTKGLKRLNKDNPRR